MDFYSDIELNNNKDVITHPNISIGDSTVSLQRMLPLSGGCDLTTCDSIYNSTNHTIYLNKITQIGRYYWPNSKPENGRVVYNFDGLSDVPAKTTGNGYIFEIIVSDEISNVGVTQTTDLYLLQTLIIYDYKFYNANDHTKFTGPEQIIYKRTIRRNSKGEWEEMGSWSGYFLPKLYKDANGTHVTLPDLIINDIIANNQIQANSFLSTSDQRLKTNIQPFVYSTNKTILDLPIYKYDFTNGLTNQIGCLAQDLQKICPELVSTNEQGFLSINESKIVFLLLQEIQKLKIQIDNMERHHHEL